ncbi:MAG TPA: gfo/Idh/MocA family oxidoreductase [Ruminococcaceae bacterium]|nr:gfo/Idh/MocA family oxidoreductase [Oscillospiraceae bacterium]
MKRYVIVGVGQRGLEMFGRRLSSEEFSEQAKLVGVYDINSVRAHEFSKECGDIPVFDDFDKMLDETKPDAVIVTTLDCYHHEYIIKAMEAGYDAISEKPMTIDTEKCRAIFEAEKSTGKKVKVTFNMRFMPYMQRVKELIKEGTVGDILHVDLQWKLDTCHGADYFRRWHRYLEKSGGLLVHKSTHHFDVVNWWLEQQPEEVFAFGTRRFYGATRENRGERCLTCRHKSTCEFYWDIKSGDKGSFYTRHYLEAEKEDGYFRDGCVFAKDININDSMSVNVRYSRGTLLTYSLIAYSPYEAWNAVISGTNGMLEVGEIYSGMGKERPYNIIKYYNRKGEAITYEVPKTDGTHGGGDYKLIRMLFVGDIEDPLGCQASSIDGAMSLLIGASANISIARNKPVFISEQLGGNIKL